MPLAFADSGSAPPGVAGAVTTGAGIPRKLHLGVLVQSYRSAKGKVGAVTTGDVAEILENKYGLFSAFYEVHEKDIGKAIERSVQGALETLITRRRAGDPWARATQQIETMFRDFIATKEVERLGIPGVPTKAALNGVNHRLRHPYAKRNPRRPSFRDTGLLMASFKAWTA